MRLDFLSSISAWDPTSCTIGEDPIAVFAQEIVPGIQLPLAWLNHVPTVRFPRWPVISHAHIFTGLP